MGTKYFDATLPSPFGTRVNFLPLNNLGPILLIAGGSISFTNLVPKDIFLANWIHRIRTAYSARGSLFPHAWRGLSARRHRNDTQKSPIFSVTSAGDSYPSRRAVQRALCTSAPLWGATLHTYKMGNIHWVHDPQIAYLASWTLTWFN